MWEMSKMSARIIDQNTELQVYYSKYSCILVFAASSYGEKAVELG